MVLEQPLVLAFDQRLFCEPLLRHHTRCHHYMRVKVTDISFALRLVDGEVDCRTVAVRKLARKVTCQHQAVDGIDLMRKCHFEFSRDASVLAVLRLLHRIPEH
ncbi:hypothetical protein D9M72_415660 [compost metagenome]